MWTWVHVDKYMHIIRQLNLLLKARPKQVLGSLPLTYPSKISCMSSIACKLPCTVFNASAYYAPEVSQVRQMFIKLRPDRQLSRLARPRPEQDEVRLSLLPENLVVLQHSIYLLFPQLPCHRNLMRFNPFVIMAAFHSVGTKCRSLASPSENTCACKAASIVALALSGSRSSKLPFLAYHSKLENVAVSFIFCTVAL
jgi:hypothetical protein